ncbi:related to cell cycle control protein cwf15 [Ustilago trichophora]|uniref:Related to cell cycle control protein cwf15 n=1 Tax=Ustilago trichophora TaxID=86804 RepID=A0A5C3ENN8_9BASI|nr:related to cell cycle control protein cwf15 [Ustilago trichophora]
MSTAHRPNFSAAKGRESKAHLSQQSTKYDIPSHTTLKFRQPATASSSSSSSSTAAGRRDLKRELEVAEWEAKNSKRVRAGLEPLPLPDRTKVEGDEKEDEDVKRRREAIAAAIELDRDSSDSSSSSNSSDSEEDDEDEEPSKPTSANDATLPKADDTNSSSSSDSSSDSDEDEQAQLLRELTKIKAERAAEKARLASLSSTEQQLSREEEIALGNPLLNLQHAFSSSSSEPTNASSSGQEEVDFGVKRRWDDDVIFKNQAQAAGNNGRDKAKDGFVNDLTRSDFHRRFMNRYIK